MLTYTVRIHNEAPLVYEGFCYANTAEPPSGGIALVIVMNEGVMDLWWLDSRLMLEELKRYYAEQNPWVKIDKIDRAFLPVRLS